MSDWKNVRIEDCADILDHLRIPVNGEERNNRYGYTPYYGANGLQGKIEGWLFDEPLILMAEDGGYFDDFEKRPVAYKIEGKSWVNNHAHVIRPKESFDFNYIFYSLEHKNVVPFIKGGTRAKLNQKELRAIELQIPSKKECQKQISRILSSIDQTIETTEALIQKYQQIKQGLMHDLFTRGVTPDGKLRPAKEQAPKLYKETPIGWIPREWDAKKLGEILRIFGGYIQTGPFGSQLHAHEYSYEGVPVIMPQDINDGKIDTDNIAKIPIKRAQTLNRHKVEAGDIIIARRGELSRAAAITSSEKNWVCGTGCFLLRLGRDELNSHFFSYAYRHHIVQRQIAGLAVGSTMPNLNNTIMNKLYFPLLEKDEQQRIVQRLFHIESHLNSLVDKSRKLKKQKLGLMQDLLTGKVRVKVD